MFFFEKNLLAGKICCCIDQNLSPQQKSAFQLNFWLSEQDVEVGTTRALNNLSFIEKNEDMHVFFEKKPTCRKNMLLYRPKSITTAKIGFPAQFLAVRTRC